MSKKPSRLYKLIYLFEESFPQSGAKMLDKLIFSLAGSRLVYWAIIAMNMIRLRKSSRLDKFCILVDVNLGDAVIAQGVAESVKKIFPDSTIDYVVKKSAGDLLPEGGKISKLHAVYTGAPLPNENDVKAVNEILLNGKYDVVFNFCPFLKKQELLLPKSTIIIGYFGVASSIVIAEKDGESISHVSYRMSKFICDLFSKNKTVNFDFEGSLVSISDEGMKEAEKFLNDSGLDFKKPIVLFNPETSSRFTMIPLDIQISMIKGIVGLDCNVVISLSPKGGKIQDELLEALTEGYRDKIKMIPSDMSLQAYSALMDFSDVFITGDTGPLHIAAAKKISKSGRLSFRNRTSVFSVFGATPARIYGYASGAHGFMPANQNAPSRVYESESHLKSMANINKGKIFCEDERKFFEGLDVSKIVEDVKLCLGIDKKA